MKKSVKAAEGRLASVCTVSAAAIAGLVMQDAHGAVIVTSVNQDIGFAPGNVTVDVANIGTKKFAVATTTFQSFSRSLFIAASSGANFKVKTQVIAGYGFARPLAAGVKFSTAPGGSAAGAYMQFVSSSGSTLGPGTFTDLYYAFSFVDGGVTKYGWAEGSLVSTDYDTFSYHFDRFAYEDSGVELPTGATSIVAVPEPASASAAVFGAALVAGSRGVRNWKKAKAREAAVA